VKIDTIDATFKKIPLMTAFTTATGGVSNASCFFVRIQTDAGLTGYGCGYPTSMTDESARTAQFFFSQAERIVKGLNPTRIEDVEGKLEALSYANPSVKSAINMACWDILGKKYDAPLYELLGYDKPKLPTSVTVSIDSPESMARQAEFWVKKGFFILKLKLGSDADANIASVRDVREAVGEGVTLRVDANGAMSLADARRFLDAASAFGIEFVEQPVSTLDEMCALASTSPIRIAADETIGGLHDFPDLLSRQAFHVATLKLNKLGGISPALKVVGMAEAATVPCMMGCMAENAISIAASLHVALARRNVKYIDLDTFMFLKHQPAEGVKVKRGMMQPRHAPGLGVDVDKKLFKK